MPRQAISNSNNGNNNNNNTTHHPNTHTHPFSPSPSTSSLTSPKPLPPNPNINPFSPLSPENDPLPLEPSSLPSIPSVPASRPADRPLITYKRSALLRIAKRAQQKRQWHVPRHMTPLDAWFGPTQQTHQVADPAIASIGNPPLRNGGFGEGFGFGGGIGGRGVGRGPRLGGYASPQGQAHYSTRKTQDSTESRDNTIQGHMGRFMAKNEKRPEVNRETTVKPRREGEWRRQDPPPHNRQHAQHHQPLEEFSPAWMDDSEAFPTADADITSSEQDGLVHFVPGEDMIAAHRKDRESRSKPLVSFFGTPAIPEPVRAPKTFNAADYLLPSKKPVEEPAQGAAESAFSSRFQKFFGGPSTAPIAPVAFDPPTPAAPLESTPQPTRHIKVSPLPQPKHQVHSPPIVETPEPERQPDRVDDHMAKLMGLLSAKPSRDAQSVSPQPPGFGVSPVPPPGFPSHLQQRPFHHPPPQFPPDAPYQHHNPGYPPPFAMHQRPPDAMQLLAHAQQPPQFAPTLNPQQRSALPQRGMDHLPPPNGPPFMSAGASHDQLRDLQYSRGYPSKGGPPPPPPPFQPIPSGYPPPFMGYHPAQAMPRPPPQLNTAQQDMLATLFAGLPRPNQ